MSKEKKNISEDFEKEFSDADLDLDISGEESYGDYFADKKDADDGDDFQKEFKAVFEEEPVEKPKNKKFAIVNPDGATSGMYDWARCVIMSVAVVVFILTFVFRLVEVDGSSMNDTLANQDRVIVTNLFYTPSNNDIIVISSTENYNKPIIKRVIAKEGQTVRLDYENDKIFVDGIELTEPYIKGRTIVNDERNENNLAQFEDGSFVIPEGKLFVLGDNREVSLDSRSKTIGLVDVKNVIGKAQFVAFPFNHFGYLYD